MKSQARKKVFVAMSGGVDSSVAAALLLKQGYEVIGAHMRCFNVDGCAERDAEDARRVAEQLKIPFYVFDFEDAYKTRVVDYMIDGYRRGITPNPDVMCNKEIKFGLFFEKAMKLGADYVATGHYVWLRRNSKFQISNIKLTKFRRAEQPKFEIGNLKLEIARDAHKDQSYFLWTLTQKQLRHCLFPIGEYTKPQVRSLAKKFGLLTAAKKDSQGICFLGQVSIRDFLKKYIKPKKGNVMTVDGRIVGTHNGAHLYTIGQRHGFGVGGLATPHYVAAKDVKKNIITIAPENHTSLYCKEVTLTNVNFIRPLYKLKAISYKLSVLARVRYRQPLAKARLMLNCDKRQGGHLSHVTCRMSLCFDTPQKFVAVGQSAVIYDTKGKEMLGGGIIVA